MTWGMETHASDAKPAPAIAIEKGVPMPSPKTPRYPFSQMQPGDSFFVPISTAGPASVAAAKCIFVRGHPGWKFQVKLMKGEKGTRVWLVSRPV